MESVSARFRGIILLSFSIFSMMLASCSSNNSSSGSSNETLRIYEMIAGNGSFTAVAGDAAGNRFQLSLSHVPGTVLYFTDRPAQEAGYDSVGNVMNTIWPRVYGAVAPNVLMKATTAQGYLELFCILEKPVYNAATGQLDFSFTYLNGNQKPASGLALTDVKMIILNNAASTQTEWSQLMEGDTGAFEPTSIAGTYTFRITKAVGNVFSYTSAPVRSSTVLTVKDFMQSWQARFGTTPPNVSIAYDPGSSSAGGVQIVTLTNPVYDEKTGGISFTAKLLYGTAPIGSGGLRVIAPSLFIDGGSGIYSETDLQKLKSTGSCENCSLAGADLSGTNLSGAKLAGADLSGANLTGATITNANMVGATLISTIGPTGMPGRAINLVNNCSVEIWAAASGNTMAQQCRSSADCNGGVCPPLTGACITDTKCKNLCTTYPCGSNADCPEPNTYCGGVPSLKEKAGAGCTKDADCGGANLFCSTLTGQCGWKNCTYVPLPVEKQQIVSPPVACTSNKGCTGSQFCYTTTSASGTCATLPDATQGNSWQLASGGTTPLFVPTPWAGRFWPRTGCAIAGSICTDLYAGTDAQCAATSVNNDRKLIQPLTAEQRYSQCRTDNDCGPVSGTAIAGGVCDLKSGIAYDDKKRSCTPGDDTTCPDRYTCNPEQQSIEGKTVTVGFCGFRQCLAYQCDSKDKNLCYPASFSCDTGTCYNDQNPSKLTRNCRQSGLNSPTLAELNMFLPSKGVDYYDISLVDGANVPVQIAPVTNTYIRGTTDELQPDKKCSSNSDCWKLKLDYNWVCDSSLGQCVNKFYCGSPGCVSDCSSFGRGLTDPSAWGGRNQVLTQDSCPSDLRFNNAAGTYVGCLSPLKACDPSNSAGRTGLSCGANLDMYQCTGAYATSCYTDGAGTNCCGCPDWMPKEFCLVGTNSNLNWASLALPYYKKFHAASPNSYTYPFDDKSGTFTCKGLSDSVNVNYNITFCPK